MIVPRYIRRHYDRVSTAWVPHVPGKGPRGFKTRRVRKEWSRIQRITLRKGIA